MSSTGASTDDTRPHHGTVGVVGISPHNTTGDPSANARTAVKLAD
jgi:hypothetical protein